MIDASFSDRHGYAPRDREITVREDAPPELRGALIQIARQIGLEDWRIRDIICEVLLRLPTAGDWPPDAIENEIRTLIRECEWYKVYDIAERLCLILWRKGSTHAMEQFEHLLNKYLREHGIGWQMSDCKIVTRGQESFEVAVREAIITLEAAGRGTASNEIHEAIRDLSRRPTPDITGAIQHGMVALECVARDICGEPSATLGQLLSRSPDRLGIPKPLDEAVGKAWGYASEMGRHLREGRLPTHEEAELIVGIAATVATYLSKKNPRPRQ
ncbi:MAG: hypothetical protein L0Y78_05585 [candidate division NC10 bacterium]|nr:hypothetical protein [candidate division NC10 bacterium]